MNDLDTVYVLRQRINRLENKLKCLTCENVQNNIETNQRTVSKICRIEAQITKLKCIHYYQINRAYSNVSKRPTSAPINNPIQMKITQIDIGDTITTIKMTPIWFKLPEKKNILKDIIYPTDGTDRNLINIIAKYRTLIDRSKDFCRYPLEVNQNSIETLIIGLNHFVHQYDGELCFTNNDLSYSHSNEITAEGVPNLSCLHLIASHLIPTAKFSIKINFDYDRDLAQTPSTMKNFLIQFHKDITRLLQCKSQYLRIFSVRKLDYKRGMVLIQFGLTTPEKNQTELLARQFQNLLRRSDFRNEKILRFIQIDTYQYQIKPILSYLQLSSKDFQQYNIENNQNLTSAWFYHQLNLSKIDVDHSWITAYHGTQPFNTVDTTKSNDIGSALYLTRHYNAVADLLTTSFTISNGDYHETFKIIIQCRVKPDAFTVDDDLLQDDETWQIVDPHCVRLDGLLLKNETRSF